MQAIGAILIIHQILNGLVISQNCACGEDKNIATEAYSTGHIKVACQFFKAQQWCCLLFKSCPDEVCDMKKQDLYTSGTCVLTVPITSCLDAKLNQSLYGKSPAENCPTITNFLQCAAYQEHDTQYPTVGGISFSLLKNYSIQLCEGTKEAIYTYCNSFMNCYRRLFNARMNADVFGNSSWWCSQLQHAVECAGIHPTGLCQDIDYTVLKQKMPLNHHKNWTEFCNQEPTTTTTMTTKTTTTTSSVSNHCPDLFVGSSLYCKGILASLIVVGLLVLMLTILIVFLVFVRRRRRRRGTRLSTTHAQDANLTW
ncbi:hypothetical protein SNE40_012431 [Patella caerulea]|uniref:Uncharacterized protein n=1 Tax=Patella caerulea TaxID=87958 RepID=A0AAN8JLQ4_PATCE